MTLPSPIRLDRLQVGFITACDDALGAGVAQWAYGEGIWQVATSVPEVVNLSLLAGPSFHNQSKMNGGQPFFPPTLLAITVTLATAGIRYVVTINGYDYIYDAVALDTVSDIRDGLVAAIVADVASPFTAVAGGAGVLNVTPTATGDIWQASVYPTQRFTVTPTLSTNAYVVIADTRKFTVNFGCFSTGKSPRNGAWDLAARCEAMLVSPDHVAIMEHYGIALWGKGGAIDLSSVDNGHWDSRVSLDVDCALRSVFTLPVGYIDTVTFGSLDLFSPDLSVSFTVP